VQCAGAGVHTDTDLGAGVGGEFIFKLRDFAAECELAGLEHALNGGIDFVLDA
jgi:hypothetical protein